MRNQKRDLLYFLVVIWIFIYPSRLFNSVYSGLESQYEIVHALQAFNTLKANEESRNLSLDISIQVA